MAKSTLSQSVTRVIHVLNNMAHRIIKWPTEQEMVRIERGFRRMAGLRDVIAAVDGTYVKIDAPEEHPEQYINRKCFHGITLQAMCDNNLKFIHCFTGYPSSVHDSRIFRNSDIYKDVNANVNMYFPANRYLLGDKAYPCLRWCIPPYIDRGLMTGQQRKFNSVHAKTRQIIERAFALLFGRFRRLKHLQMKKLALIPLTIIAACVLHNICLSHEDDLIEDYIADAIDLIVEMGEDEDENYDDANTAAAVNFRDILCAEINR